MHGTKKLTGNDHEVNENGEDNIIEERKELIEDLFDKAEEYVKTNIALAKLKATDKVADIAGAFVTQLTIVVLVYFFLLMINLGIAFWLGTLLGTAHYGFMIVAGFYALLALVVFVFRKSILKTPISNAIISQLLK